MEKNTQWIVVTFAALALILGMVAGSIMIPTEKEVIKEVEVEVPVETLVETEVEVEVEKDFNSYRDDAIELCLLEFEDNYELDKYETLEARKISDDWTISFDTYKKEDRVIVYLEDLTFRLFDTFTDDKEDVYEGPCKVTYREDKDPKVELM